MPFFASVRSAASIKTKMEIVEIPDSQELRGDESIVCEIVFENSTWSTKCMTKWTDRGACAILENDNNNAGNRAYSSGRVRNTVHSCNRTETSWTGVSQSWSYNILHNTWCIRLFVYYKFRRLASYRNHTQEDVYLVKSIWPRVSTQLFSFQRH